MKNQLKAIALHIRSNIQQGLHYLLFSNESTEKLFERYIEIQ